MPRTARLDAPGVLHHVIIRGIEGKEIFRNNKDRDDFIKRLETLCPEMQISCYAWAFMSNHAHFLFRTGQKPLSTLMRSLLTGYVISFNKRHRRQGQLFQNRYKSIVCQEDTCHTYFTDGYRKYGPALPHSLIYQKLKPFRTGIERSFVLVKENRYLMEMSNFYKVTENVTIHALEDDIVLTQDIIFDYLKTGKISPVLNLNY